MSPELFKYKPYNYKSDIWAFGCVMYEICNLKHAFNAQTLNGLALKILKGNYMPISTNYSQELRDLIVSMLNVNPKKRPSIYDIIQMPFIKQRVINYVINLYKQASSNSGNLTYEDLYISSVEQQCKALGILDQVQAGVNSNNSMVSSQVKKLNSAAKKSQSAVQKKKNQELELAKSKKISESLSQKIQILETKINSQQN